MTASFLCAKQFGPPQVVFPKRVTRRRKKHYRKEDPSNVYPKPPTAQPTAYPLGEHGKRARNQGVRVKLVVPVVLFYEAFKGLELFLELREPPAGGLNTRPPMDRIDDSPPDGAYHEARRNRAEKHVNEASNRKPRAPGCHKPRAERRLYETCSPKRHKSRHYVRDTQAETTAKHLLHPTTSDLRPPMYDISRTT